MIEQAYKIKDGVVAEMEDLNKFAEMGFDLVPFDNDGGQDYILVKICKQDFDGEIVQGSLKNIYNNPSWRDGFYKKHKKNIENAYGLKYKNGKAVLSDKFRAVLQNWQLRIWSPFDKGILTVHSGDPFEAMEWRNAQTVESIAGNEIDELLAKGYIEPVNLEYEE